MTISLGGANNRRIERVDNPVRILIVDDDELVAESLARCCEEPDMSIIGMAATAKSALTLADEHQPDVVLMDNRLDGADGVEVASSLMDVSPKSRVLMVTGVASTSLIRAAKEAGCAGCVEKTMKMKGTLPELIRRIHKGENL